MFVYQSGSGSGLMTLQWMDATGRTQPLVSKPGKYLAPEISPDGSRVALTDRGEVWVYDPRRDTMTPLTFGGGHSYPIWTPDGRYILYQSSGGIFYSRADGGGSSQPLVPSKNLTYPWSFTPDGKRLGINMVDPESGFDLWTVTMESDGTGLKAGTPEVFLQTQFDERHATFSPDGRWIAYTSNVSGTFQVYVRAYPDNGGLWQVSNSAALYPRWSRSSNELFFRTVEGQIMVASYTVKGDTFVPDKPRLWTEKKLPNVGLLRSYDLAPDGKHIATFMPVETAEQQKAQNHLVFVLNFFDELRRKAPGARP